MAIALTCWVAGCALEPDVGDLQQDRCSDRDTDPDRDVSFRDDIVPLFERTSGGCFQCHDPSSSNPVGVEIGGLDMTSYRSLLAGGARSAGDIVVEGAPCDSVLFLKLTSAPFGSQMPADGPPYWTEPELNLMHDWIAEGAEDN